MKNTPRHKARRLRRLAEIVYSAAFDQPDNLPRGKNAKIRARILKQASEVIKREADVVFHKMIRS